MGILQQASGTFTGTSFTPTLPATSSAANCVVLIVAGNTTVTTPAGWTLRTSQVNQMGHYLWDRQGVALASVAVSNSAGQGTWWIAEIAGGSYQNASSVNAASNATTYVTPSLTPTAGVRTLIASLGSTHATTARTISGWTNSFVEVADVCQATADFPMQGVAVRDDLTVNGSTAYSTTGTYSLSNGGRSAIIASYVTTAAPANVTGTLNAAVPKVTSSIAGAAGSITGTLSAALPKVTASLPGTNSGGSGVEHTVHGATYPGTVTSNNDGQGITVETSFYTLGTSGWRLVGVKLWVPTGSALIGQSVTLKGWVPGVTGANLGGTDQGSGTVTAAAGWNEVRFTPVAVTASTKFAASYTTSGIYFTATDPTGATQAADGSQLYESESDSGGGFVPQRRGAYRYADGSNGNFAFRAGLDVIVDEGAAASTTGTLSAALPKLTSNIPGSMGGATVTGTMSASVPKATVSVSGTVTITGSLSAAVPKVTSSIANIVALTIAQENALTSGVQDRGFWFDYGNDVIPGFARSTYYTPGQTAQFSVNYNSAYTCEVWRLGWYGGAGNAREVDSFAGTTASQPAATTIANSNGAVTCAAWSANVSWQIPADATPGWYWLFMKNAGNTQFGGVLFCVSDANAKQPILVVASEATWGAAYNGYGGNNVYGASTGIGAANARALCSTYDKPIISRDNVPQTHFFNGELAQLRFFERFGFDVGYTTIEQINNDPTIMDGRQLIVFSGHNEYLSQRVYDKTEAVIAAGVNVANFSANDFFWRVTFAGTTFPTGSTSTSTGRVMWCKKDSLDGPSAVRSGGAGTPFTNAGDWTGTWQDTRWANRKPSTHLLGDVFRANGIRNDEVKVPFALKSVPLWRNAAGVQALTTGQTYSFGAGTAGMEWDMPDGPLPSASLSASTVDLTDNTADVNGAIYNEDSTSVHAIQMVRNGSAHILNFNTTQWGWALDDLHLRGSSIATATARQATLNGLYDLGAVGVSGLITGASLTVPTPVSDIDAAYNLPTAVTGTMSATLPKVASSVSGASKTTGTLVASTPLLTAAVTGSSLTVGTLSAAVPKVTSLVDGASFTTGSLAASTPLLTAALTGQSFAPTTGTLTATLPRLAASLSGTIIGLTTGSLAASTPLLVSAITGSGLTTGSMSATTPLLLANLSGTITGPTTGQLVADVPRVVGSVGGVTVTVGVLSGTLPRVRGRFDSAVQAVVPRQLVARLRQPRLRGTMRLPRFNGRMEP